MDFLVVRSVVDLVYFSAVGALGVSVASFSTTYRGRCIALLAPYVFY